MQQIGNGVGNSGESVILKSIMEEEASNEEDKGDNQTQRIDYGQTPPAEPSSNRNQTDGGAVA